MPNLALKNLAHLKTLDPTGILYDMVKQLEAAHNNIGAQVNAAPVGTTDAPPQIGAIHAEIMTAGVHKITITDNSPVSRGVQYFAEGSTTPDFKSGSVITIPMGPSRVAIVPTGAGAIHWRGFHQYPTSAPSDPVYAAAAVDAGGGARIASLSSPGSGTEPSLDPQPGAGFGFDPTRDDGGITFL